MWLDRLSNQPTPTGSPPAGQNRSYSPAPRRSMHLAPGSLARPGYSPRASSLSLVSRSNTSNISLPGAARISNGSTLKQQITPPDFVDDPLAILGKILGLSSNADDPINDGTEAGAMLAKPLRFVEEIAFNGLSLQEFAHESMDGEMKRSYEERRSPLSMLSAEECEYVHLQEMGLRSLLNHTKDDKEKDKLEDLHQSISVSYCKCDYSITDSLTCFRFVTMC